MNQTTATSIRSPVDSEALRLQLEEDGKVYFQNPNSEEAQQRLPRTIQTNDCREIIAAVVDGDDLANVFAFAAFKSHIDVIEAYLNHGMSIDIKDQNGCTALICSSGNECEECSRLLLDRNAKVDVQNNYGDTALMYASQQGNTKIVEMLLQKNANPDLQNNNGITALMSSSLCGYKEVVQLLLTYNADIDLKNKDGKTALDLARNEEIKEALGNHLSASFVLK